MDGTQKGIFERPMKRRGTGNPMTLQIVLLTLIWLSWGAQGGAAQEPKEPSAPSLSGWWLSTGIGLTDLAADHDAPGSMFVVGIARTVSPRVTFGLELGSGLVDRPGVCRVGTAVEFECLKASWWPTLGFDVGLDLFHVQEMGIETYLVGQVGGHGPDLIGWYGLGTGFSFETVKDIVVGVEVGRRYGSSGGSLYLFRLSRPLWGKSTGAG